MMSRHAGIAGGMIIAPYFSGVVQRVLYPCEEMLLSRRFNIAAAPQGMQQKTIRLRDYYVPA